MSEISLYPNVDETKFAGLFSEKGSRPNIHVRRYVAALVLKRMYRMPDEVLMEFLRCGALNFLYALHTTQEETQPLSESSLRRFRRRLEAYIHENKRNLSFVNSITFSTLPVISGSRISTTSKQILQKC